MPVPVPAGATIKIEGQSVTVKGPLGELTRAFPAGITMSQADGKITIARADDSRFLKGCHGLWRTLVRNMAEGVTKGYAKGLSIEGTGFKASVQGPNLMLTLGFASPKAYPIPAGIKVTVTADVNLKVEGVDKQLVGLAAARIRSYYPVEPYKGKGVKYVGEIVKRKQGKTVA
jgi:large subunit ribosomal protein L6